MLDVQTDLSTLDAIAPVFFEVHAKAGLSPEDEGVILECAHIVLTANPFNAERGEQCNPPITRPQYIQKCLSIALALTLRCNEIQQTEAELSHPSVNEVFQIELKRVGKIADPLVWKSKNRSGSEEERNRVYGDGWDSVVVDVHGRQIRLELAPYTAKFPSASPRGIFFDKPYYVPFFRLEPRTRIRNKGGELQKVFANRREFGRRKHYIQEQLGARNAQQIEAMYTSLSQCLIKVISYYLRQYGFRSLPPHYWSLLSDINTHGLSVAEISRKRGLTRDQVNGRIKMLKHRGWVKVYSSKKRREVMIYFPIMDNSRELCGSLNDLAGSNPASIMRLISSEIDRELYKNGSHKKAASKAIERANRYALKNCSDQMAIRNWEHRLCEFIIDFVTTPVAFKGDPEVLEERFKLLSRDDQLRLFTEAKRRKISLWDILNEDLSAVFADVLAEEKELENRAGFTLASITREMEAVYGVIADEPGLSTSLRELWERRN